MVPDIWAETTVLYALCTLVQVTYTKSDTSSSICNFSSGFYHVLQARLEAIIVLVLTGMILGPVDCSLEVWYHVHAATVKLLAMTHGAADGALTRHLLYSPMGFYQDGSLMMFPY